MNGTILKEIVNKVRIVIIGMPWKKILTFLFFVFLSAIFWFMQIYRQNFHATYYVPVKYTSIPDGVVFNASLPSGIDVSIEDNGFGLFKYYFTGKKDSLIIDVSDIINNTASDVLQGPLFEQFLKDRLLPTSTIVSYIPNRISFDYSLLQQKKMPVILDVQFLLAAGYLLDGDIHTIPDSVSAYGSKDVLAELNYAYTISDTVKNVKSQEPLSFAIKPISNVKFVPEKVDVVIPVEKYTQKDVIVPITVVNGTDDLNIRLFPSTTKVSFLVGLSQYSSINEEDFSIQLDYNDMKNASGSVPLHLTVYPDRIQNISLLPSEVEFIFEKK